MEALHWPDKEFRVGRNNFALTIFAPIDCDNNCHFCTSKKDYTENPPNLNAIIESLKKICDHRIYFHDVVITGGEPFKDLSILDTLLQIVDEYIDYTNLYINTTLPLSKNRTIDDWDQDLINYITDSTYITGINVSRHITMNFKDVLPAYRLGIGSKPMRINCVLDNDEAILEDFGKVIKFVNRYCGYVDKIVFRQDYRTTTFDTLHSLDNPYLKKLDEFYGYRFSTSCNVCHTDLFGDSGNIVLHRGLEHSSIKFADFTEVNDLIIRQDGLICYDWDRECIANDEILNSISIDQSLHRPISRVKEHLTSSPDEKTVSVNDDRICQICRHYTGSHTKCNRCEKTIKYLQKHDYFKPLVVKSTRVSYKYPCSSEIRENPIVDEYTFTIVSYDKEYFVNTGKYRLYNDEMYSGEIIELCDDSVEPKHHEFRDLSEPVKIDTKLDKPVLFENNNIKLAYNMMMEYIANFVPSNKKPTACDMYQSTTCSNKKKTKTKSKAKTKPSISSDDYSTSSCNASTCGYVIHDDYISGSCGGGGRC